MRAPSQSSIYRRQELNEWLINRHGSSDSLAVNNTNSAYRNGRGVGAITEDHDGVGRTRKVAIRDIQRDSGAIRVELTP